MTPHRRVAAGIAVGTVALTVLAPPAAPAAAHGATTDPVSRSAACGADGKALRTSPACKAAAAATGAASIPAWDNLRLPDVAGRDRTVVPDGRLCSAGLSEYRGLDLPRKDWPSTALKAGAEHTFAYRGTIAHRGTFRLYLTRSGYDPGRALRWADLDDRPFLTAVDPPLRSGSYRMTGRLPADRAGHHVIYAVWQNSDTPDTYYSCSDVTFAAARAPAGTGARGAASPAERPSPPVATARAAAIGGTGAGSAGQPGGQSEPGKDLTGSSTAPAQDSHGPLVVAGLAAVLAVCTALAAWRRARRHRPTS